MIKSFTPKVNSLLHALRKTLLVFGLAFFFAQQGSAQTVDVSGLCIASAVNLSVAAGSPLDGKVWYSGNSGAVTVLGFPNVQLDIYWSSADNVWYLAFDGQPYFQNATNSTTPPPTSQITWTPVVDNLNCLTGPALVIEGTGAPLLFNCPTLAATSTANYSICSGDNTSDISGSTTVNTLDVKLVYFTSPQATNAARYTGGNMIGSSTTPTAGAVDFNNLSFPVNNTASPIIYYVYAILDVTDPQYTDNTCQPSVAYVVTVNPVATVDAGAPQTVCASSPAVTLAGTVGGGASTGTWSGGAGNFNPNASTLNATYTPSPAEITAGTVTLTLTTDGPCPAVSDQVTFTINPAATVDAGSPQTVCANSPAVTLAGVIGGAASSATWSGGTGIFNPNATTLNATYTPSAAEITAGTVTLTLTTNDPTGPCPAVSDQVTFTINAEATVDAGSPQTVCANSPAVTLAGVIGGAASSATWSGGTGIFNPNATTLNATYTPSAAEITAGTVTLTLTTNDPTGPCPAVSDQVTFTITALPVATFSYSGGPYCSNGVDPSPTFSGGGVAGVFSSTAGLVFVSTATGEVDLSASTAGTYTVTNTIAAANGCAQVVASGGITVNPPPTANIATSGTVCLPTVTFTGNNGTAPYTFTYKIGDGLATTVTTSVGNSVIVSPSTVGVLTYTLLSVKDANDCGQNQTGSATITASTTITGGLIVYNGSPFCANAGTASVTRTASAGGTYSCDTQGLSLNATTGAVNLAASTPGTYLVKYTIVSLCTNITTTAYITITAAPTATIAYSNTPYCKGSGTASVTLTGKTGGVFSSTSGLSINANTGAIDLAASTAGTYAVTYTIAAANGCGELKTTANVAITTAPTATIAYANTPYCSNAGTASVTLTGSQGGTFNSTTGLSINANTGAIDLAASTAGSYVVTYTIAAANGCPEFKTTANVSITTASTATIAYSNSPYCKDSGTATVTLTGKTGGIFSSTSGLSINANTGAIDLAVSTAGSYVVTYTIVAANGCGEFKTTANVAITTTPSATIAYSGTPYCANAGTASVTLTGSLGGVFSSTTGLSINANTGAIDLAASMAGSYVVTYTIAAANGCPEFKTTANVSITTAPTATIAYSGTPYCKNSGTATVTLTGKTGGVFSSTTGLSINDNTGAIDLAASTAGSYVVTYTIAAANGCGELKTTANIAITTTPSATIAYANTPYCSNAGTASVTLTGSQGGTFSSTTGLSINVTTGEINLSASTAGSYLVTYTIAAANGCPEFKTTANVSITAAPTATIAYSNTPYCANSGTATVTLMGKMGGVFSSTTGLSINANTGAIDLATSMAGSYVVTYTLAAANGCGELKTTANVAITTTPSATIAYSGTPYCANAGTASVTLTGSQGGTFSSTAGLSINIATGEINLAASTAGSYVVTYTIAAANGCAEFKTTTSITITTAPTATIAYSNSTYCASGTATVSLTGATGGVFSSSTGLSINANTGAIDLAASTAGTYVVTYTLAAANGCPELKANANVTIQAVLAAPVISSNQSSSVCMGTEVLLYTNCPQGSTVLWSNNSTATILALNANSPSEQTLTVKCLGTGVCESPSSAAYTVKWSSTFSLTLINVGKSQSAIKENNAPKSSWSSQFITSDAGPTIETSTEANPTIYYSENMNKTAPRYWTIHAETCNLGTAGSLTFDMLSKDEQGVERSYNTHENSAPYLMYANRSGFTELYAQNHPLYGFYQDNGSGGNVYDAGLPKGVYKLGIRYWDLKGWGSIYPATRKPQGNVLAYQEFWFKIQSKDGVGKGAARVAADLDSYGMTKGAFASVMPNPVSNVLHLKVTEAKNQKVNVSLLDASGRTLLQRGFIPETNQHQEEFEVSELANGMYFLKVNTPDKQATLKVIKVN